MFESAEIGNVIDKETYKREAPKVREALLAAQRELPHSPFRVIIIIGGIETSGRSEVVNLLLQWMDARGIETHAVREPTDEERERPIMWRFWRQLPRVGRMGIFFGGWYTRAIIEQIYGDGDAAALHQAIEHAVDFEQMLVRENTLLIKLWLHLPKAEQKKRLKRLEKDPRQSWRVTKRDWDHHKRYEEMRGIYEATLSRTNLPKAPWTVVEATDERHRNLTVARTILERIWEKLAEPVEKHVPKPSLDLKPAALNILNRLDLTKHLEKDDYDKQLAKLQAKLAWLSHRMYDAKQSMILVFEGNDAAGKGGAIRRLTQVMDARGYHDIAISAPTDEEAAQPYLWRFWRHLPRLGEITIFDRSWYGRVLVERVEGFCKPADWQRAYGEINAFEAQLRDFGTRVLKFWLAISPDEQLRRFEEREETPYKQYKITEEDWRNRDRWGAYEAAACDMIEKTNTEAAPWCLVEAQDKNWARIEVLKRVVQEMKSALREWE
jgi:AMP-polyphosphate phosphotransferase